MKNLFKYVVVIVKYFSRIAYYFRNSTTKFFLEKNKQKSSVCLPCQSDESPHEFIPMPKIKLRHWIWSFALVPLFVNAVSYNQSKSNYEYYNN